MRWSLLMTLSLSTPALATTPTPAELTGVYLKQSTGAMWDPGVQLVLTSSGRGTQVILRCGKGELSGLPQVLAARVTRGEVSFSLPEGGDSHCPAGEYKGRFRVVDGVATSLTLRLPSDETALDLQREFGFAPAGSFYPYE
ncbi:MAG: hypothetical protein H4O13_17980 [Xanthomonadales bacterium]|nr:hypothetical protein [Xanthomonadales bacterium]